MSDADKGCDKPSPPPEPTYTAEELKWHKKLAKQDGIFYGTVAGVGGVLLLIVVGWIASLIQEGYDVRHQHERKIEQLQQDVKATRLYLEEKAAYDERQRRRAEGGKN